MTVKLKPGKPPFRVTILCACVIALAGLYHARLLFDPGSGLPPTRLADEDFRRCMQREIDQIVETFDTGVRG